MRYVDNLTQRHECYPHERSATFEKVSRTNFLLKWFTFKTTIESHNLQPECLLFVAEPRIYLPSGDKVFLSVRIAPLNECVVLFFNGVAIPYPHYMRCAFRAIEGGDPLPDKTMPARTYGRYLEAYKDFDLTNFRTLNPFNE